MHLIISLSVFALATFAQTDLAFVDVPASVVVGEPTTLTWRSSDDSVSKFDLDEDWIGKLRSKALQ